MDEYGGGYTNAESKNIINGGIGHNWWEEGVSG